MDKGLLLCATGLLAFIGIFFSFYTTIWCEFVDIELPGGGTTSFGPWRYKSFVLLVEEGSGNIWKVDTCSPISDSWDLDAKWKLARASTIISPVMACLGGIACYFRAELAAACLLLAALFQGLTFLFLESDARDLEQNPFIALLQNIEAGDFGDCEMGLSAVMSIVASALFFVGACVAGAGAALGDDGDGVAPGDDGNDKAPEEAGEGKALGDGEDGE